MRTRQRSEKARIFRTWQLLVLAGIALLPWACGDVGVMPDEGVRLRLFDLYPGQDQIEVARDVKVMAVFSESVFFSGYSPKIEDCNRSTNLSPATFYLQVAGQGPNVTSEVSCSVSPSGEDLTVAILRPRDLLEANTQYCVSIDARVEGMTLTPIGVGISSCFTTRP